MKVPEACDVCPKCIQKAMPKWNTLSKETARCCSNCQFVEEKNELASDGNTNVPGE